MEESTGDLIRPVTEASGRSGVAVRPETNFSHATALDCQLRPPYSFAGDCICIGEGVGAEDDRMTLSHGMALEWGRKTRELIKHRASKTHRSVSREG